MLQNIAKCSLHRKIWGDFSKQKIAWAILSRISKKDFYNFPRFTLVDKDMYVVASASFFSGSNLDKIVHILNSEYSAYYFFKTVSTLDSGGMQMGIQYVENALIPTAILKDDLTVNNVNQKIYEAFNLNYIEINFIKEYLNQKKKEIENR